jgi:hypothetical protein
VTLLVYLLDEVDEPIAFLFFLKLQLDLRLLLLIFEDESDGWITRLALV